MLISFKRFLSSFRFRTAGSISDINRGHAPSLQLRAALRAYFQSFSKHGAGKVKIEACGKEVYYIARSSSAGFTLIELLVSISILLVIVSVVVFRFASFDSAILLRTLAYDIGLSVREAQSYSLSSLGNQGNFRLPYGVSFAPGGTSYVFFGYTGSEIIPRYDLDIVVVDLYTLGRSFEITDVCVVANGVEDCAIDGLDISFRRPEYTSLFYVPGYSGNLADIESGIIKVSSTRNNAITGIIEITYTGQIEVSVE